MNPHFYRPKPVEPVMLTHSHQAKANIIGDQDNFVTLNIAYSPVDHLGFAAGAAFLSETKDKGERYFNPYVSAGYYNKFSINTLMEVYGGFGYYTYKNADEAPLKELRMHNYFIQPSIAYIHKNFEIAFTLRGDYLKRYNTITSKYSTPDTADFRFGFLKYSDYFFLQPGVTARLGFKYIKFQLQAAKSAPFNNKYASLYGTVYSLNVIDNPVKWSSGINVDLDILRKRKSKTQSDH